MQGSGLLPENDNDSGADGMVHEGEEMPLGKKLACVGPLM